jgi:predicted HNH restriction endonuclease
MYDEKEKLISIGVSEAAAVEDIRKEFSDSVADLVMENKALKDTVAKLKDDLEWTIKEIDWVEDNLDLEERKNAKLRGESVEPDEDDSDEWPS